MLMSSILFTFLRALEYLQNCNKKQIKITYFDSIAYSDCWKK